VTSTTLSWHWIVRGSVGVSLVAGVSKVAIVNSPSTSVVTKEGAIFPIKLQAFILLKSDTSNK
jgi:hypothetical protein